MPTEIALFDFNSHQLRTIIDEHGEPWFIAMDIAEILEYSDAHKMTMRLDDDEKQNRQIGGFGPRGVTIINESGLFAAILGSQKPQAKVFRKYVTGEVLPAIRKTGGYQSPAAGKTDFPALTEAMRAQMAWAKEAAGFLGDLSQTSKLRMLGQIAENTGLPANILPAYSPERLTRSLKDLLIEHDYPLTAAKANLVLEEMGYLIHKERQGHEQGKDGRRMVVAKKFWSITGDGLKYGKNETPPQSPRQTQPLWYVDTFPQLLTDIETHQAKQGGNP